MENSPAWTEICFYCDRPLDDTNDYSCVGCNRQACDNCCQACQEDDCDYITCDRCVDWHLRVYHPGISVSSLLLDVPVCG